MTTSRHSSPRVFKGFTEVDSVIRALRKLTIHWGPAWRVSRPSTSSHPFLRIEFLPSYWVWDRFNREFTGGPNWAELEAFHLMNLLLEHGNQILTGRGCGLGQYFTDGDSDHSDAMLYTATVERAYSVQMLFRCPPDMEPEDALRIHGGIPLPSSGVWEGLSLDKLEPYETPAKVEHEDPESADETVSSHP